MRIFDIHDSRKRFSGIKNFIKKKHWVFFFQVRGIKKSVNN